LELKGKKFSTFAATSVQQLDDLWTALLTIDEEYSYSRKDKFSAKELSQKLIKFMEHSCTQRHYFFDIIKCGETLCLPPRLPPDAFGKLNHLPDPVPEPGDHYKKFTEVFGTKTTEEHRPSSKKKSSKDKSLVSIQHVKNRYDAIVQSWHLLYAKRKLKRQEKIEVEQSLNGPSFLCGSQLQDLDLADYLLFVRKLACEDPIERLHYSAKFEDICIHCSGPVDPWSDTEPFYLQCKACEDKSKIPNTKNRRNC